MKLFKSIWLASLFLFFGSLTAATKQWTFLLYMESSADLQYWAVANLNAIMAAHPSDDVAILVQLHMGEDTAWRYKIEAGCFRFIEIVSLSHNPVTDAVSSARWATQTEPSTHFGFIIWNHGFGILDPEYQGKDATGIEVWNVPRDGNEASCSTGTCPVAVNKHFSIDALPLHRGCLFNYVAKNYMNNVQMVQTFKTIHEEILHKKVDLLGTDCCKMSMLEVCYQLSDHVDYLVGAENCELLDGWNYTGLFNTFKGQEYSPEAVVRAIIDTYSQYYIQKTKQNIYTQTALNLAHVGAVTEALQDLVGYLVPIAEEYGAFDEFLQLVRSQCPGMCDSPYYIDLWNWAQLLVDGLAKDQMLDLTATERAAIRDLAQKLQQEISRMVVAKAIGSAVTHAHGFSIYYPRHHIDNSYYPTLFATNTNWLDLVEQQLD